MKNILILFLISFSFSLSAQTVSDIKVTYSKKDARLEQVFRDLEVQYGVRFSYATAAIESKIVDADFEDESIQDVLDYLLQEESMDYKIVANNILLRKSKSYKEVDDDKYKTTLHIKGKITNNHDTNQALDYASISISNSSIGTYSDQEGRFDIEIPYQYIGEDIVIRYLGFEDEVYKISELKNEYIIVAMEDGEYSFDEVMIVNKEKPLKLGNTNNSIKLNKTQIASSTSGVMGADIGRQIQLLPGIAAQDDDCAAIKIRGSNSDETLMVLDGMPIYNANHYYGIFSGVNTAYIDSVHLFKNTYPLQYGGKTAGLVELFSDYVQPTSVEGNLYLDFLTASGDLRIPISDKSHFSLAGRSTFKEVNNQQFNTISTPLQENLQVETFSQKIEDNITDPSFTFYDVNAKYMYRINKNDFFSINFYRSSDNVNNTYKSTIQDKNENELNLTATNSQSWSNTAASMMFSKNITSRFRLNTTAYLTQYTNEEINNIKLNKKYKSGVFPPVNNPLMAILGSEQKNELMDLSVDSHLDFKHGHNTIKLGATVIHHDIEYAFNENNKDKLSGKDSFYEITGYGSYDFQLWDKVKLSSGLRVTNFTNLDATKLSPRILLQYQSSEKFTLKSSFNIENQVIRELSYEYRGEPMYLWVTAGQNDIPVLSSQNIMIGSTLKLSPLTIDIEVYQKNMKGHIEYVLPNPGEASNNADQNRVYTLFEGNGRTKGIDIILSTGFKKYDTYLSYTLSECNQQFEEIFNNKFFPSENDRTHQLKWVNTLTTGNFTWGLNGIYISGRPYTDVSTVGVSGDIRILDPKIRLRRLKAYHRIDFSTAYMFNIGNLKASLTASVFNLMNTKNVKYIQSVSTQVNANNKSENIIIGNESELLNRTFNLGLQIGF